ncbi:uncharacterized protein LOC111253395 [Varroa destructor]|uniref:Uncharacterized protein n=1 Tax=Varroa destructor TaxID=109461 RepID=A0A7M7KKZ2_VARDE|nr:uncharacterized protein LOC111253395 [Varroa destructor]
MMEASDLEEEENVVELYEQARFELTRQRKAHEFQKRLLIEYETEVQRLHDRNQALEAALRDAEKKKARLQQDISEADDSPTSEPDATGHSSAEDINDGSCPVSKSGDLPPLQRLDRCKTESVLLNRRCRSTCLSTQPTDSEIHAEGGPLAPVNTLLVAHLGCAQYRSNDAENNALGNNIRELQDQIANLKEANAKSLVKGDQQVRQIAELTEELLGVRTAYGELVNQVERLIYERNLFERDAADISEHRRTLSLERPLAEIEEVHAFRTLSSIGDELGLTGHHINFGEYAEKHRETAENVNWDALLEVEEAPELLDRLERKSAYWTNTSLGHFVQLHPTESIVSERRSPSSSGSRCLSTPNERVHSEDIDESSDPSTKQLPFPRTPPQRKQDTQYEVTKEVENGNEVAREGSVVDVSGIRGETPIDSETRCDVSFTTPQVFSNWGDVFKCLVPWRTSTLACCSGLKVDEASTDGLELQRGCRFAGANYFARSSRTAD